MKEEIRRIMRLVQEGKLSPEDAAELVDAFTTPDEVDAEDDASKAGEPEATADLPPPPPPGAVPPKDPFRNFVEFMEGLGRDVTENVNWHEVAGQVRLSAKRGMDAIKVGVDGIKQGKINLGWLNAAETKEISMPLVVPDGKTLRIENRSGNVKVTGGFNESTVYAKAKVRGTDPEDARKKADAYTLIVEESDHVVLVRQPESPGLSVDLVIQLNKASLVEVKTESGDILVYDTAGGAKIHSQSGDVALRGLNGPIDIAMQTGEVKVEESTTQTLSLENKTGDVALKGVKGNVSIRSASGDVAVRGWAGKTLSIESVTGEVNVDLQEPTSGAINVRTVNGDARVSVPDGCDCRVALSTLRGDVSCSLELQDEARHEQRITGRLGAGTGSLDVSAVNGDITVGMMAAATV